MIETTILFLVGIFVGIYASVVGGGALILVPFFSLLGTPIATAIATMRVGATAQELVSTLAFWRKGAIDWGTALYVSLFAVIGGYIGAQLVLDVNETLLSYTIAMTMVVLLFLIPKLGSINSRKKSIPKFWRLSFAVVGFLLGIYGGFYGAGFGTFILFFFALIGGSSLMSSAGNARLIGFLMSLSASYVFLVEGAVDWALFYPITAGMIAGSWYGVDLAEKYGSQWIKILLTLVVIASAIKLFIFPG